MDLEDGKLLNDTKLVSIEKSRDELFPAEQRILTTSFINFHECLVKINSFEVQLKSVFAQLVMVRTFD